MFMCDTYYSGVVARRVVHPGHGDSEAAILLHHALGPLLELGLGPRVPPVLLPPVPVKILAAVVEGVDELVAECGGGHPPVHDRSGEGGGDTHARTLQKTNVDLDLVGEARIKSIIHRFI